ncbi:hypothetical protein L1049_005671 [Liquidambar formosana]|uniref:MULE transposase domain-containing protein n=1 Tax=Liquidambar formosana TaxID=63359 RepID=A0AAP0RFR5_LIQFO
MVLLLCKYRASTTIFCTLSASRFDDLVQFACGTWQCLNAKWITFTYELPESYHADIEEDGDNLDGDEEDINEVGAGVEESFNADSEDDGEEEMYDVGLQYEDDNAAAKKGEFVGVGAECEVNEGYGGFEGPIIDNNDAKDAKLLRTNPRSTIQLLTNTRDGPNAQPVLKRFYVCLHAIKIGFRVGYRPLIRVDGCHLKGPSGMQLLAAVGWDGNDQKYPIANVVVEAETKDAWIWFLRHLFGDIGSPNHYKWCFISDQQKGLLPSFKEVAPTVKHWFCVRHLHSNFSKQHKGKQLKDAM